MEPSHRSIVPNIPGVPWWAAVLIAVGATALGYAFDAGHKELTHTFAGLYIAGCVAAILAVRQAAVFTAVIQPPLILFGSVPAAYWLFHGGKVDKFKDLLINCGYPLIERFPLMLGTAGLILLIGLIRWYFGKNSRASAEAPDAAARKSTTPRTPLLGGLGAKLSALLAGGSYDDAADADATNAAPPAHAKARTARTGRTSRTGSRTAQRSARSRSRHARPDDSYEPGSERPRRAPRRSAADFADYDPADAPPRPRRRRPPGDSDLGAPPPREMRREPHPRRNPYERPAERPNQRPEPRSSRFNPYDGYERPEPSERTERRSRHERRGGGYEPRPPHEPPYEPRSRRATAPGSTSPTHHPISQVRYRGQAPLSEPREERRDEPGSDRRSRSRTPRRPQHDTWEYDT